jgi:hypothetical protein
MRQLKDTKRPMAIGKAAVVVQDAEAYRRLLDLAATADADEGRRQGPADLESGRAREVGSCDQVAARRR